MHGISLISQLSIQYEQCSKSTQYNAVLAGSVYWHFLDFSDETSKRSYINYRYYANFNNVFFNNSAVHGQLEFPRNRHCDIITNCRLLN